MLIKKILRNHVIIDAGRGDEMLTMLYASSASRPASEQTGMDEPAPRQVPTSRRLTGRQQAFSLDREEVISSLSDLDQVMKQVSLSPYMVYDRASGLRITNIKAGSIFEKIGLRNRDVILGVNDLEITGPELAAEMFKTIAQGGEVTIKVKGRRRSRLIRLNIE